MRIFQRGGVWWVSHYGPSGLVRMSTGCRDRSEAERKAKFLLLPVIS